MKGRGSFGGLAFEFAPFVAGYLRAPCLSGDLYRLFGEWRFGTLMLEFLFVRHDGLDSLRILLAALSFASGLVYLSHLDMPPSFIRTFLKTFTVGVLALLPLTYLDVVGPRFPALLLLSLALALSAVGDFFLALADQKRFFVYGLGSFLFAHIVFVLSFFPEASSPSIDAMAMITMTVLAAAILLWKLWSNLGRLAVPVVAYFAVIMVMVAVAFSVREASWMLGAGAMVFALSDSLIAVRKFLRPFPAINDAVWVTYCMAQFMIAGSMLRILVPA